MIYRYQASYNWRELGGQCTNLIEVHGVMWLVVLVVLVLRLLCWWFLWWIAVCWILIYLVGEVNEQQAIVSQSNTLACGYSDTSHNKIPTLQIGRPAVRTRQGSLGCPPSTASWLDRWVHRSGQQWRWQGRGSWWSIGWYSASDKHNGPCMCVCLIIVDHGCLSWFITDCCVWPLWAIVDHLIATMISYYIHMMHDENALPI